MLGDGRDSGSRSGRWIASAVVGAAMLVAAPSALAHIERASYWPDPGVDTADGVPTGGDVPEVRPLFTALDEGAVGVTRVVCQTGQPVTRRADVEVSREKVERLKRKHQRLRRKMRKARSPAKVAKLKKRAKRMKRKLTRAKRDYRAALEAERLGRDGYRAALAADPSMQRLDAALQRAVSEGYVVRPSEGPITITHAEADQLREFNARLLARCAYDEIQPAVNDSGNNDRVVVMPGIYTEPSSRAAPTDDPSCDQWEAENDRASTPLTGGFQDGANTYAYVFHCPNDQNLIAVLGREPRHEQLPQPALEDRHGIPDEGPCIRCNLQLEGSGVASDDVVIDGGEVESGDGTPVDPEKDVVLKADRADGFVLRNMKLRHAREHAIYVHEIDGYVLERFKVFHGQEYGTLQFTSDHGLVQDCEAYGAGDAGIYPGSAPDTGEQRDESVNPDERFNTEITRCDMHHNVLGYSGTAANAVWVHHNDFYDNTLGFVTDVITAAGHPGFPQDSDLIEENEFYSNNFNPYVDQPADDEVVPLLPIPVGTALWILGGNNNEFRNNYVWDNWRRGVMLSTVQDALVCGDNPVAGGNQQAGCNPNAPPQPASTSYRNQFHHNVMGRSPSGEVMPNGSGNPVTGSTDFWWDQWLGSKTNCWYQNEGKNPDGSGLTSTPPAPLLPSSCAPLASTGTGGVFGQDVEVYNCLVTFFINRDVLGDEVLPDDLCPWYTTPPDTSP